MPKPFQDGFPEDSLQDGGQCQKNIGSPVDMLVDTVSRMQKDMAILCEENRVLRTPAASQAIQAPRRAALTTTKVPRFDGTTIWEQYHQVFEAIVRSNVWDLDTAALQLFSHLEGDECRSFSTAGATVIAIRISRRINGTLWFSGSTGRLSETVRTNHQNNRGRPGNFCNSFRNVSC